MKMYLIKMIMKMNKVRIMTIRMVLFRMMLMKM